MGVGGGGGGGESLGIIKVKRNFNTYLKLNILGIYRGGGVTEKKIPSVRKILTVHTILISFIFSVR